MIKIQCLYKDEIYYTNNISINISGNLVFKNHKTDEYMTLKASKVLNISIHYGKIPL